MNPSNLDMPLPETQGFRFDAYPNPVLYTSGTTLTLQLQSSSEGQAEIALFDMVGRSMGPNRTEHIARGSQAVTLDVRGYLPGLYVCRAVLHHRSGTTEAVSRLVTILP
jgi:hypothetical protein